MREEEAITLIMATFILAGAGLMYSAIVNRRKMREMEHRERLAMIERGLMPGTELDPAGFEASTRPTPAREAASLDRGRLTTAVRFRTVGVLMIGLGAGLALLISFTAGQPGIGFGIGGAFAMLGAAALLNYFLMSARDESHHAAGPATWSAPARPPRDPPSNVAP